MRRSAPMALFIVLASMMSVTISHAQCLKLALRHDPPSGRFNPDSIMADTCYGTRTMGDGIVPWTRHYAKRYFDVELDRGFLSASAAADDEGFFDIDDFDTTHADYITWKQLSDDNGGLAIRRMFPEQTDTTLMSFFAWQLKFNDYARIDTVESVLKAMPSCRNASYAWQMAVLHGIPSDPGMKPKSKGADIANPGARLTNDGTTYSQQELGWQASHYEIDIPMAWEITKGTANVVVAVSDGFKHATKHQEHQDLHLSTNTTSPGNFLYSQSVGAGTVPHEFLADDGHGYHILHQVSAEENGVGMVGVAPNVKVIAVRQNVDPGQLDTDPNTTGLQNPHVMNHSYGAGALGEETLWSGVVMVGCLPNFLQYNENTQYVDGDGSASKPFYWYQNINWQSQPGVLVKSGTTSAEDVKMITVGGYHINQQLSTRIDCDYAGSVYKYTLSRGVRLRDSMNFSPGLLKFPSSSEGAQKRAQDRADAALDLIVPYCDGVIYGFDDTRLPKPTYDLSGHLGNSFAIPLASGVVGLMMSVHERLGRTGADVQRRAYDIMTFTADKIDDPGFTMSINQAFSKAKELRKVTVSFERQDVQAYPVPLPNKHMFEVSGLGDGQEGWNKYAIKLKLFEKFTAPDGKVDYRAVMKLRDPEGNDPLGRWWGNRVGFGRLNAFRSVAHAIPEVVGGESNVQHQYPAGSTLTWTKAHKLQGRSFLHLGKFKEDGKRVLDEGGIVPPGEPAYRNNNGKTLINTSQLSVGNLQTVVIDGILTTTAPGLNPTIATTGDGKILATGWMDNVTLSGYVYATDLRVRRLEEGNSIIFKSSSKPSVLYDTLWADGKGTVVIDEGTLEMQPASVIIVRGQARIVVKPGAKLVMEHGATIIDQRTDRGSPCIQLMASSGGKQGGKLEIADNMELVVIDAFVGIQSGAELVVGKAAKADGFPVANLFLRGAEIEKGGKLSINHEAIVHRSADASVLSSIVIKPEAVLEFPPNITTKINVPFDVHSGATLRVPPTAVAKIGALNVRSGGSVIVQGGGTLQFLDETNTVRGRLIAEGTPQNKAVVKAAQEVATRCEGIYKVPIVRLELSPDAWPVNPAEQGAPLDKSLRSYFHAQHATFENVFTTLRNMPVVSRQGGTLTLGMLTDVTFQADRKVFVDQTEGFKSSSKKLETRFRGGDHVLLNVEHSRTDFRELYKREFGQPANYGAFHVFSRSVTLLAVGNCVFGDAAGVIARPPSGKTYRDLDKKLLESDRGDYPVIGLKSTITLRLFQSDFAYLLTGVIAEGNGQNRFEGNSFAAMSTALRLKDISSTVCSNTMSSCVNGVWAEGGTVEVNHNTFGSEILSSGNRAMKSGDRAMYIGSGCFGTKHATVRVLGNTMTNYGTGLHAQSGRIEAGDAGGINFYVTTPPPVVVRGRNTFVRDGYNPGNNLYQLGQAEDAQQSDIFFDQGTANIVCGKTMFNAVRGQDQLQKKKGTAPITVRVSSNNFGVDSEDDIRRNELVRVDGTDLRNSEQPTSVNCTGLTRPRQETDCDPWPRNINGPGDIRAMLMAPQGNGLGQLPLCVLPNDADLGPTFAESLFDLAHAVVASPNMSAETRIDYLDYAVRALREHPNADSATDELVASLVDVSQNPAAPRILRARAVLECAGVLAEAERFSDAHQLLLISDQSLFTSFDSLSFVHMRDELQLRADIGLTDVQKTSMVAAIDVARIEHAKRSTTVGLSKSMMDRSQTTRSESGSMAVSVYPNPTQHHIIVRIDALPAGASANWLDVRVRSLTGEEVLRRRIDGVSVGHEVLLDELVLESGVYIVEAQSETSRSATIITVVR